MRREENTMRGFIMRRRYRTLAVCMLTIMVAGFVLTACSVSGAGAGEDQVQVSSTHNPTGEEVLKLNPEADIFMFGDLIYIQADPSSWVQELKYEDQSKVGEITAVYNKQDSFINGMSTKLPVKTEIYAPSPRQGGEVLIIELDGKQYRYLALIEG